MRWKKIVLAMSFLLLSACSSYMTQSNQSLFYRETAHFLYFGENISLTSISIYNDSENFTTENVKADDVTEVAKVRKNWLKANFLIDNDIKHCIEAHKDINISIENIFADKFLPENNYTFNVYVLKRQSFKFTSQLTSNNELSFYFSLEDCTPKGLKSTFMTIRDQLVHELSHLIFFDSKLDESLSDRKEEEYAHTLEVCNAFYSKAFSGASYNSEFNPVYNNDRVAAVNPRYEMAEKYSELGKVDAHIRAREISNKLISIKIDDEEMYYARFREEYCAPVVRFITGS